jgi:hypothetical protein
MSERDLQQKINRINGALEVLGLLRERLALQRDELGGASGREAVDEMLTRVDALQVEYQHRRAHIHPDYKSYQFFSDPGGRAADTARLLCRAGPG